MKRYLSDEAVVVVVPELGPQDFGLQGVQVEDLDTPALLAPIDDLGILGILNKGLSTLRILKVLQMKSAGRGVC